jgi:formate--tetrahydrofolate ligase
MYEWGMPVKEKIMAVATKVYGAADVAYSREAERDLRRIRKLELEGLPVCIAKTQKSLSDDPKLTGRPEGFTLHIRGIEIAAGAGFLVPLSGNMMRMPGLPAAPAALNIDIDDEGVISGLF